MEAKKIKIGMWNTDFNQKPLLDSQGKPRFKGTAKEKIVIEIGDQITMWENQYKVAGDKKPSHNLQIETPGAYQKKESAPTKAAAVAYGIDEDIPF